jgi:hypothetical protein
VWILLADGGEYGALAIVGTSTDAPTIYTDTTSDSFYWFDADTVDLYCPSGHRWQWGSDNELVTDHGTYATVAALFSTDPGAPFTRCAACVAYENDERDEPCDCDGSLLILCPDCGQRCDVELTGC